MNEHGIFIKVCGLILSATFLSGCVSTPKKEAPALHQAARHNQKGLRAELQKKFKTAEAEFAESYRLYSSVEDYNGMVTTLINSSRLYRSAGAVQKAELVTERAAAFAVHTPDLAAEVWFEKAKLLLLKNRYDEAALWCDKARKTAPEIDQPRMVNLSAEILRSKGELLPAGQLALDALKLSRNLGDRREEANALRLLGSIELTNNRTGTAISHFNDALAIDKELALSRRISADLRALSQSFEAAGNMSAAAEYLQRALDLDAASADGDRQQTIFDLERLVLLQERSGKQEAAVKTEELRRKLLQEQK